MRPDCTQCTLSSSGVNPCPNEVYSSTSVPHPRVMVVAEAPGFEENKFRRPLIGTSGEEARHHLDINGISRFGCLLTNTCLCQPPGNRTPTTDEIRTCTTLHLIPQIQAVKPKFIISMGATATQFFLGPVNMELVHGIPRPITVGGHQTILIPTYHPAAGLHSPETMILFHTDMVVAGQVVKGQVSPHPPVDTFAGQESYHVIGDHHTFPLSPNHIQLYSGNQGIILGKLVVALDTEWAKRRMWCLSLSVAPGTAWVVMADQPSSLESVGRLVAHPQVITIIHNALYDLPVLRSVGIEPSNPLDTMVMAYLLQNEPQGLKPLAFRHRGMEMSSYTEMVAEATRLKAMEYLEIAATLTYPDPEMVLEWKKGEPYVRTPQNIIRKITRILKAIQEKGADPADSWKAISEGKEVVEAILGPLEEGELCDIEREKTIYYSARDADATIRVFPGLWHRIVSLGLEDTLWRDMKAMPMVVDMMANGMKVNLGSFASLSVYLQSRMDLIQRKIQALVGHHFPSGVNLNPNSAPQMAELIYYKLKLQEKGGRHKAKKGGKESTADDILKRYLPLHPVVQDIIDWRGYAKLKSSYADAIPKMVSSDGRIRTTLRMTRVATGRLSSSKPNLMAQPVRSEEGRMVRDCYEAEMRNLLVSGDYSQVEMRVAASEAKDTKMLEIFWSGEDIHSITASEMFGIPLSQVKEKEHRYPAKRVGFGILNLITAEGLHRELVTGGSTIHSLDDCRHMIKAWFEIYSGIAAYMKANGDYAKRYGYVRDMWGRIRYIPGIKSMNRWGRIEAERQAGNAPIQMGAQGIIKEGMGKLVPIYRELEGLGLGPVKPLIQIHDDIVWEIGEDILPLALDQIKKGLESSAPAHFLVPLEVDFKVGKKWGSLKKV